MMTELHKHSQKNTCFDDCYIFVLNKGDTFRYLSLLVQREDKRKVMLADFETSKSHFSDL
jgi:hypothetical protein